MHADTRKETQKKGNMDPGQKNEGIARKMNAQIKGRSEKKKRFQEGGILVKGE